MLNGLIKKSDGEAGPSAKVLKNGRRRKAKTQESEDAGDVDSYSPLHEPVSPSAIGRATQAPKHVHRDAVVIITK